MKTKSKKVSLPVFVMWGMNKYKKFLLAFSILLTFVFIGNFVSAQTVVDQVKETVFSGSACGISSEGKCKQSCDPYDEIYTSDPVTRSGSVCLYPEICCISTKCTSNSTGFGSCKSSSACNYGSIGINTSDCAPPKLCCVLPKETGMQVGQQTITPINQGGTDVFTGEDTQTAGQTVIPAEGKTGGLVPCLGVDPVTGQRDCTLCDVFKLIKNLINLFIQITFALAGGFIVWGAIEIMVAGGDEAKVKAGRERVTTAIYGIVIVLVAWLFIGTVLQILTDSSSVLPWNKINC